MSHQPACARGPAAECWCICASPRSLGRITPHRARLLALIADYRTNADIAASLGIAVATVKREVEDLRDLVACSSKRELARWWVVHEGRWSEFTGVVTVW